MPDPKPQRVALVTSGAVRVGRAISVALFEAGWDLMVAYRSSSEEADTLHELVVAGGRRCEIVQADLSEPAAPDALAGAVDRAYGRLDLVVNSAASFEAGDLLDVDAETWDRVMAINARAPHLVVRATARVLTESGGSVVNITDLSAFEAWIDRPAHAVSKAALAHLTRIQARALAPDVRVNGIAPGAVMRPPDWSEERWQALAAKAPLERAGTAEDVARAVLYLAEAEFVTGQIIAVDGGRLLGSSD